MLADEWRSSKLLHYWEQPEYWEESWRLEETCCHSDSSEKPSVKADVKNSNDNNNNNKGTKNLMNLKIQTLDLIHARRPNLVIFYKKQKTKTNKQKTKTKKNEYLRIDDLAVPADQRVQSKRKKETST